MTTNRGNNRRQQSNRQDDHHNKSNHSDEDMKIKQLFSNHPIKSNMERHWKFINDGGKHHETEFTILTYNILAQMYAKRQDLTPLKEFTDHSLITNWTYRRKRIIIELKNYSPSLPPTQIIQDEQVHQSSATTDIVCFQECDNYKKYWSKKFNIIFGMDSTFSEKFQKGQGCATFWRADRFEKVAFLDLDLSFLSTHINGGTEFVFGRRDTANLTLLKCLLSNRYLLVINNHLAWDPVYPEVKLCQMFYILQKANNLLQPYTKQANAKISIILTGDFNSLPQSEVHQLIVEGRADINSREFLIFEPNCSIFTKELVKSDETKQTLLNPFGRFKSSYQQVFGQEPAFTNLTSDFSGTLDYIFNALEL